jgi:hypothetical protein
MSRGLTDPIEPQPEENSNEIESVIRDIIMGQNKLHDRLVQLEKQVDHLVSNWQAVPEPTKPKKWRKGL